jgi:hypothetical protein
LKILRVLTVACLVFFFGFGCAAQPAAQENPQLAAYGKIKVGDSAEAVTAVLESLNKGDKNAVDKSDTGVWQWAVKEAPKNWNDDVFSSPVTGSLTILEVAFKDGKVIALRYECKTVTKSSVKTESPAGTEIEILRKISNEVLVDHRVKGDKAFLQSKGY